MSTPLKVLIIDDSENDARLLVRRLEMSGFAPYWSRVETREGLYAALDEGGWQVLLADLTLPGFSGQEALQIWRDLDGPPVPDVVILDNRMPELSGLEVARLILEERPSQLILLYSAFLDDTVRARAQEIGITRCVSKDELDRLPRLIRELTSA